MWSLNWLPDNIPQPPSTPPVPHGTVLLAGGTPEGLHMMTMILILHWAYCPVPPIFCTLSRFSPPPAATCTVPTTRGVPLCSTAGLASARPCSRIPAWALTCSSPCRMPASREGPGSEWAERP